MPHTLSSSHQRQPHSHSYSCVLSILNSRQELTVTTFDPMDDVLFYLCICRLLECIIQGWLGIMTGVFHGRIRRRTHAERSRENRRGTHTYIRSSWCIWCDKPRIFVLKSCLKKILMKCEDQMTLEHEMCTCHHHNHMRGWWLWGGEGLNHQHTSCHHNDDDDPPPEFHWYD